MRETSQKNVEQGSVVAEAKEKSSVVAEAKEKYFLRPTVLGEILAEKLPDGTMRAHRLKMPDFITVREEKVDIPSLSRIGELCASILMTAREIPPTVTECKKAGVGKSRLKKMELNGLLHVKSIGVNPVNSRDKPKYLQIIKCVLLTPQGRKVMEKYKIWEQNNLGTFAKARSWLS